MDTRDRSNEMGECMVGKYVDGHNLLSELLYLAVRAWLQRLTLAGKLGYPELDCLLL